MAAARRRGPRPAHTQRPHAAPRRDAAPTHSASAHTQRRAHTQRPHAAPTRSAHCAHTQRPHAAAPTRSAHTQRPHAPPTRSAHTLARIARVTHTQSHNRRHGSRLGAGRRGWDAAEQRSRGRLAAASEMRPAGSGFDRVLAGLTDLAAAGSRTGRASARVVQTARGPLRGASSPSPAGRTERRWVAAAASRDEQFGEPL